jgi:hypothetical protein
MELTSDKPLKPSRRSHIDRGDVPDRFLAKMPGLLMPKPIGNYPMEN